MKLLSLAILATFASTAYADQTYICTYGEQERVISLVYTDQDNSVPCEVRYKKEGEAQTLWRSESEAGYCESKTEEFVQKQKGWGWSCDLAAEE
ncbi:hypothetical protein [Agaribacterium sp. ZY112]|uniref:hypothetical protein n=1 Tax=Agaribacterium sp. ZY112 TaxID=3233574 RepID=UPI003523B397